MKKLLLLTIISVLFLVGCNNSGDTKNPVPPQNETTRDEEIIKNKYTVKISSPITIKNIDYGVYEDNIKEEDRIGEYATYEMVNIDNINNDANINKINEYLDRNINNWEIRLDLNEIHVVNLPNNIEYYRNFIYTFEEFYQNEQVIVIKELYSGASGGGASNSYIKYYVFDKNTGNLLTINDISNDSDALIKYLYNTSSYTDSNKFTSWYEFGTIGLASMPKDLKTFEETLEGTWAICEDGIVVSRSGAMSGPVFTIKYTFDDIQNAGITIMLIRNFDTDFMAIYKGVEISKNTGIQTLESEGMRLSGANIYKYDNVTFYNYQNGISTGISVSNFGKDTQDFEGAAFIRNIGEVAFSKEYNAIPRTITQEKDIPTKLKNGYTDVSIITADLDGDSKTEHIAIYNLNLNAESNNGIEVADSRIELLDSNYNKIVSLLELKDGFWAGNKENKVFLNRENVTIIDIDNDDIMEIIIDFPGYDGTRISIIKYNNGNILGEVNYKLTQEDLCS